MKRKPMEDGSWFLTILFILTVGILAGRFLIWAVTLPWWGFLILLGLFVLAAVNWRPIRDSLTSKEHRDH